MNNNQQTPQAASVGVDDIFYLFFRHKWKILFCTLLGFAAAAYIYFTDKTAYRSQAKLFVRYIVDKKDPRQTGPNSPDAVRPLDTREAAVMLAEAEILRSRDSILNAVETVGAKKVLAAYDGGTNSTDAAQLVANNLDLELGKSGGIMVLTLSHRDQDIAQRVLSEVITEYQKQHAKVHDYGATYDQVLAESDEIKKKLDAVEIELRKQKTAAHVSSLDQTKTQLESEQTELSKSVFQTEADLAELRALLEERKQSSGDGTKTNNLAADDKKADKPQPTAADIAEFAFLSRKLQDLTRQESEYLQVFSESSKKVVQVRQEISETKDKLNKLPIDPSLIAQASSSGAPGAPAFDWVAARAKIAALEAKHEKLTNLLASVRADVARVDSMEDNIVELERQKKTYEDKYVYYQKTLDEMHLDQNIDARSRNNISIIQTPTILPPDLKKLGKKAGAAAGAGIGLGILLALLADYVFNPSVKRSKEIEVGLKVPVLVSIPNFGRKLKLKRSQRNGSALQKNGLHTNGEIPPWEDSDPMLPYYEALRDRVVMSYNGDLHKPKIVGLTSCHAGAGVSRLATGLAASLSRDAERNVLLVGLQRNKVAVSAFAKGRPTEGLEPPAEDPGSDKELVAQNLYSLATTGRNLAGASVVQSFSDLMPKLKISEYDYIIFDLPPLTQTSGSLRLATQMERAILVVEAEETGKASAKRATTLLKASQPRLFSVLNKAESYGPKALREDI